MTNAITIISITSHSRGIIAPNIIISSRTAIPINATDRRQPKKTAAVAAAAGVHGEAAREDATQLRLVGLV